MATTKANLRMMDIGIISPLDFGAAGDGTTDDTVALNKALQQTDFGVVDLGGKTYKTTTTLNITRSDLVVQNGTIHYQGTDLDDDFLLQIIGTPGSTSHTITVDSKIGSNTVTLGSGEAASYSVGDWVQFIGGGSVGSYSIQQLGENFKVTRVNTTDDTLVFHKSFKYNVRASDNNTIKKYSEILENITLDNITFIGQGLSHRTLGTNAISSDGSTGTITVTESSAHGMSSGDVAYIADATAFDTFSADALDGGYIITVVDSTTWTYTHPTVVSGTSLNGGGANIKVESGRNTAFHTYFTNNIKVINCTIKDCPGGFSYNFWTSNLMLNNNIVEDPSFQDKYCIKIYGCSNIKIQHNNLYNTGTGIYIDGGRSSVDVLISDNIIDAACVIGIQIDPGVFNITIKNNTLNCRRRWDTTSPVHYNIYAVCPQIQILNNVCTGANYCGIRWLPGVRLGEIIGDSEDEASIGNSAFPWVTALISGNTVTGTTGQGEKATVGIWIHSLLYGPGHIHGMRITDNLIYGFKRSMSLSVGNSASNESSPGLKETIIANNVCIANPNTVGTKSTGIWTYSADTGSSAMTCKRTIISNNVFSAYTSVANNGVSALDLYDEGYSKYPDYSGSSISGNIIHNKETTTDINSIGIRFTPTTTDTGQTSKRVSITGNIFLGWNDSSGTAVDVRCLLPLSSTFFVGGPTGTSSADTGTFWGLNCWSQVDNSSWAGTTSSSP